MPTVDEIEAELVLIHHVGIRKAAPKANHLLGLKLVSAGLDDSPLSVENSIISFLTRVYDYWGATEPKDAKATSILLPPSGEHINKTRRRQAVGKYLDLTPRWIAGSVEPNLLRRLAEKCLDFDSRSTSPSPQGPQQLSFELVSTLLTRVHRDFEESFEPDLILTMSGPGSIVACLTMQISDRHVPVVHCVTFPRRPKRKATETAFAAAAEKCAWYVLQTATWNVYLPNVVTCMELGSKILIFDDRVNSGTTHNLMRTYLENVGYVVETAAMVRRSISGEAVNYFGTTLDGQFFMPWGSSDGRA